MYILCGMIPFLIYGHILHKSNSIPKPTQKDFLKGNRMGHPAVVWNTDDTESTYSFNIVTCNYRIWPNGSRGYY